MTPEMVAKGLPILGTIGILSLFLPGIEKAWNTDPDDNDSRVRIRTSEFVYIGSALAIASLASYAYETSAPLWITIGFVIVIISMHEIALCHRSGNVTLG